MNTQSSPKPRKKTGRLIAFAALGAYFAVLFAGGLLSGGKASILDPNYVAYLHPLWYGVAWLAVGLALFAYGTVSPVILYGFTWIAALCYTMQTAVAGGSYFLTFAMCGLMALVTILCGRAIRKAREASVKDEKKSRKALSPSPVAWKIVTAALAVACGSWMLYLLLSSYLSYTTGPSSNTGLYVQLLHSLRSGFSFDTTIEFGQSVSHMAAHVSPIFLLYLPFYAIIPSPVTLMVLQVGAVCSAVIPLWLIGRDRGLSPALRTLLCGLLCAFPVVWGGASGTIHEYALLLPLLLWLLWGLESKKTWLVALCSVLILCVGETCAIHLFAVALYHLIRNRKGAEVGGESRKGERIKAIILMGVSVLYFAVTMAVLTLVLEDMDMNTVVSRFENVTGPYATNISTLIREILYNPALAIYEMLTESKLHFILLMSLPLGLLPFLTKKKAGLVFLLPLLIFNLLSDFPYHYSPDFPFAMGTSAYALYMAADGLATLTHREDRPRLTKRLCTLAVCFTLIIGAFRVADYGMFLSYAAEGREEITAMDQLLELVEEDASVSVSARLLPHLATRDEVYLLTHKADTTYVVLDLRDEWGISAEEKLTVEHYQKNGYTVVRLTEGVGAGLKVADKRQ